MYNISDISKEKLNLSYPCSWTYKIIINDDKNINDKINKIMEDKEYKLNLSKISKKGNYKSYSLEIEINSDFERTNLYTILSNETYIKMVL